MFCDLIKEAVMVRVYIMGLPRRKGDENEDLCRFLFLMVCFQPLWGFHRRKEMLWDLYCKQF